MLRMKPGGNNRGDPTMSFIKIRFTDSLENIERELLKSAEEMFQFANTRITFFQRQWRPQVDICEEEDGVLVLVEIAGVNKEDLHVEIQSRMLKISGKREFPDTENKKFLLAEIPHGYFERRIALPYPVHTETATATYNDGVLKVWVKKQSSIGKQKIPIR